MSASKVCAVRLLAAVVLCNTAVPWPQVQASSIDSTFNSGTSGSGSVEAGAIQTDGKVLLAGSFDTYNGVPAGNIVRIHVNGGVDLVFTATAGTDGEVAAVAVQSNGRVVIGGSFGSAAGSSRQGLARLNADGTIDSTFQVGAGADGAVLALAVQADGKIIAGGNFTAFDGRAANGLVRLNADGTLDTGFDTGLGFDGPVLALALQADGKLLAGGTFTLADGQTRHGIARLDANGRIDAGFQAGAGFNGPVYDVAAQADGKIVIAGDLSADGQDRALVRLNAEGSLDASFNPLFSDGAIGMALAVEGDGQIVAGGDFERVNGVDTSVAVRLNADGSLDTSFHHDAILDGSGNALLLQADGKVLVMGEFTAGVPVPVNVARLRERAEGYLPERPVITVPPADQTVTAGADVTFQVAVVSSTDVTYQWQRNGIDISGETDATLEIEGVTSLHAGDYTVEAANAAGVETSTAGRLTVLLPEQPEILVPPRDQTVKAGADVTFSVAAVGAPPLSYQWLKDGAEITGEINATLSLSAVAEADAGPYAVRVSNSAGTETSAAATLTVEPAEPPSIVVQPVDQTVPAGATVLFSVSVQGTAPLSFEWRKDGLTLAGATSATLRIENVTSLHAGDYTVRVSNAAGFDISEAAQLTVDVPVAPAITLQPVSQTVTAGANVSFSVVATGSEPLAYQWFKDGILIAGEVNATLALDAVTTAEAGSYSVEVSNAVGAAASADAELDVRVPEPPTILIGPVDQTVAIGASAVFNVAASGEEPLRYEWRLNGTLVADASASLLLIPNAQPDDAGLYEVTVTSAAGLEARAEAELEVVTPPLPGSVDGSFEASTGAEVSTVLVQADGRIVIAGGFTVVNDSNQPGIARLHTDGSLDLAFAAGSGPDGPILDAELQADGKLVIVGEFTTVQDVPRHFVARLYADGQLDAAFSAEPGPDAPVRAVAIQADGKVVIGGSFDAVAGSSRPRVARLQADGRVDAGFDIGTGANGDVLALAIQADGKILVGGNFTAFAGSPAQGLVRLNADGSVDAGFDAALSTGGTGLVQDIAIGADGKIIVGGSFTTTAGTNVVRLNADGSVDAGFNVGAGPDGPVLEVALDAEGGVLAGGDFNSWAGTEGSAIVRLHTDGSADAQFNAAAQVEGTVEAISVHADGTVLVAGSAGVSRLGAPGMNVVLMDPQFSGGVFSISVGTQLASRYFLETTDAVTGDDWTVVAEVEGDGSVKVLNDENTTAVQGFYRVRVQVGPF